MEEAVTPDATELESGGALGAPHPEAVDLQAVENFPVGRQRPQAVDH
jgi:hypothetical protein